MFWMKKLMKRKARFLQRIIIIRNCVTLFFAHLRIWRDCVRRDWHTNNLKIEIFLILLSLFFSPSIFFSVTKMTWAHMARKLSWERERRRNKEIKKLFLFSREICPLFCVSMKKICFNKLYISHTRLFLYLAAKN